jgi:hypothetical protein
MKHFFFTPLQKKMKAMLSIVSGKVEGKRIEHSGALRKSNMYFQTDGNNVSRL